MKNYRTTLVGILCLCLLSLPLYSQTQSCADLTIAIERDDSATIVVGDFINQADLVPSLTVILRNSAGGILKIIPNANSATSFRFYACPHIGRNLTLHAELNGGELCMSNIRLHEDFLPIILGRSVTVWCDDTLVNEGVPVDGVPPTAIIPCQGERPAKYTGDWVDFLPCTSDTAKIIYRMYEAFAKDGKRVSNADTIIVRRFPAITDDILICNMMDTISCDTISQIGPYLQFPGRTVYLVETYRNADGSLGIKEADLDPACGVSLSVENQPFNGDCPRVQKVSVEIKQFCSAQGNEGYFSCEFWLTEIDTTPPNVQADRNQGDWDIDTLLAQSSSHDCVAHISLPRALASDDCHGVNLVKAIVEDQGSYTFNRSGNDSWMSFQLIEFPSQEIPVQVIYEAFDDCHLVGRDTFYVSVTDRANPLAASNKMVNVSLTGKKSWIDATTFDEGSWDNCGIELLLARRVDWKEACIELCADFDFSEGNFFQNYYNHLDSLGEVGAHYANTLKWLALDPGRCTELLLNGWLYDLHRYQRLICDGISEGAFDSEMDTLITNDQLLEDARSLGGGWSDAVPFSCEDLCDTVMVELLAMDYWCNWNKTWTKVWVEDKSPVIIAQQADPEIEISCFSFHETNYASGSDSVSIADVVTHAQQGQIEALDLLNSIFGGYQKAWLGDRGEYVDGNGAIIDREIDFLNKQCNCRDTSATIMTLDDHGQWISADSVWRICDYYDEELTFHSGILLVNCPDLVQCQQEVWADLDDCGIGSVYRKFIITSGCPGLELEPIELTQEIRIFDRCDFDLGMFELPGNVSIESCGLIFETDGSGKIGGPAHPDLTGRPEFIFDSDCYLVGVGYNDKALEIVPEDPDGPCYKIARTWCMIDWCGIDQPASDWQINPLYSDRVIKYTQYIKVFCECPCILNCSDLRDTAIACADIPADLTELYPLFGVPSIESPDPTQPCEGSLESITVIDTNSCGIGDIIRTWYLMDPLGQVVDSCMEVISMAPPSIMLERTNLYKGDAEPFNCSDSIVTDPVIIDVDGCPLYGNVVISNDSPYAVNDSNDASGTYPVGNYIVTYTISSDCFTSFQVKDTIQVIDDVNPLVVAFSDPCVSKAEWLNDFQNDPLNPNIRTMLSVSGNDNCGIDTVQLVNLDSMFFPDNIVRDSILYIYDWQAVDVNGNLSEIKTTTILVSDLCTVSADVRGMVLTENQQAIGDVMIKTTSDDGLQIDYFTSADGRYSIEPISSSALMIRPFKNDDPRNGISTADIILLRDHILGVRPLANRYQVMAADVNDDGKINPMDLIQLRGVLLESLDEFPSSNSWRFINNISGTPEYHVQNLEQSLELDFTGVKIGDINRSVDPHGSSGRSKGDLLMQVNDRFLKKGETHHITFDLEQLKEIRGLQFSLQFDPGHLRLIDVPDREEINMTEKNFALQRREEGIIAVSWDKDQNLKTRSEEFVTLVFKALEDCRVSDVITINGALLRPEAYDFELNTLDLSLQFRSNDFIDNIRLFQNSPNPFESFTVISFELPSDMKAIIRIMDVTGKTVKLINDHYQKGRNSIPLDAADLPTGILYYQLETNGFMGAKKMVLIK